MGYTNEELKIIIDLILSTRLPQKPVNKIQKILCDADLSHLGKDNFFTTTELLRQEISIHKEKISKKEWVRINLKFFEGHSYHTNSAKMLYSKKKRI